MAYKINSTPSKRTLWSVQPPGRGRGHAWRSPLTSGARQVLKEEFDEVRAEQLQEIQRLRGELRFDSQPLASRAVFDGLWQRRSGRHGARWRWRVGGRYAQGSRGGARRAHTLWASRNCRLARAAANHSGEGDAGAEGRWQGGPHASTCASQRSEVHRVQRLTLVLSAAAAGREGRRRPPRIDHVGPLHAGQRIRGARAGSGPSRLACHSTAPRADPAPARALHPAHAVQRPASAAAAPG
jgi:hypothetical protein